MFSKARSENGNLKLSDLMNTICFKLMLPNKSFYFRIINEINFIYLKCRNSDDKFQTADW